MEKVGVMAVVEGLSSFVGDIGKMNSAMDSLKPQGNMLTQLFTGVGNAISSFGQSILRVAEVALGVLLRDAIQAVIGKLKQLISVTIEAGAEFQTLKLRLERLNFNSVIDSVGNYEAATRLATEMTKEQLTWLQKLAVTTPYDAQDIANVYTLARSYGFTAEASKGLTKDIADFAAGMGLGNTEIERIIVNFGQMVQQGKVTQREMNDLARGAFVPVNDVLKLMQEETGLTGAAFDRFRNSTEGVNAFMRAFSSLVETRFAGATEQMARTFQGATANAQDFIKSLLGFNVVRPILDAVGGKIADMLTALTAPGAWESLSLSASRLGEALSGLATGILGGDIDTTSFTQGLLQSFNRLTGWVTENKDKIIGFFQNIKDTIINEVIPFIGKMVSKLFEMRDWFIQNKPAIEAFFKNIGEFIQTKVVPFVVKLVNAFMKIGDWVDENGSLIKEFFTALGAIVGNVFTQLTGVDVGGGMDDFLGLIKGFMTYVVENQDTIANFITNLLKLSAVFTVIGFVLGILMGIFTAIITPIIAVIGVVIGLVAIITALFNPITWLIGLIAILVIQLVSGWQYIEILFVTLTQTIYAFVTDTAAALAAWWETLKSNFMNGVNYLLTLMTALVSQIIYTFKEQEWGQIGRNIIEGLAGGIMKATSYLVQAAVNAATAAIEAVKEALGVSSPSKVFTEIGEFTMAGFAKGITDGAKMAEQAMQSAVAQIAAPALNMPAITQQYAMATSPTVNNQNSYTNNYNLTVNSKSPVEPIVQDYNMLQSLGGA